MRIPYRMAGAREMARALVERARQLEERLKDPAVQAEIAKARDEARAAAHLLRDRFGARRVRLFGSLARMDCFEGFDIDLAVEGVGAREFFRAWAAAAQVATRELDLVDVREAPPLLLSRIEQDGIDLL